jgi:hypothetical protein
MGAHPTEKVSREEFLRAVEVVEGALSRKDSGGLLHADEATEAAMRTMKIYSRARSAEMRARRKVFRVLEGGKET